MAAKSHLKIKIFIHEAVKYIIIYQFSTASSQNIFFIIITHRFEAKSPVISLHRIIYGATQHTGCPRWWEKSYLIAGLRIEFSLTECACAIPFSPTIGSNAFKHAIFILNFLSNSRVCALKESECSAINGGRNRKCKVKKSHLEWWWRDRCDDCVDYCNLFFFIKRLYWQSEKILKVNRRLIQHYVVFNWMFILKREIIYGAKTLI